MKLNSKSSARSFAAACFGLIGGLLVLQACGEPTTHDGQNADRQPPETKRIDLGDGLELIERREFRDGKVASLVKTYKRNGETIMMQSTVPLVDQSIFRDYYRDGKEVLSEEIDGKGQIIKLYVKADDGSPSELFERQVDGTTAPASTKTLEKAKQAFSFIKRTFTPIAEAAKQGDKKAFRKHLDAAIEEVEVAKKAELDDSDEPSE